MRGSPDNRDRGERKQAESSRFARVGAPQLGKAVERLAESFLHHH